MAAQATAIKLAIGLGGLIISSHLAKIVEQNLFAFVLADAS
jgi:hypothetical protein